MRAFQATPCKHHDLSTSKKPIQYCSYGLCSNSAFTDVVRPCSDIPRLCFMSMFSPIATPWSARLTSSCSSFLGGLLSLILHLKREDVSSNRELLRSKPHLFLYACILYLPSHGRQQPMSKRDNHTCLVCALQLHAPLSQLLARREYVTQHARNTERTVSVA